MSRPVTLTDDAPPESDASAAHDISVGVGSPFRSLMSVARWIELGRILLCALITLLYWRQLIAQPILILAVAIGLYPLLKIGLIDLLRHRRLGTEIFVSLATIIALATGETVAGAVIMVIILIAEFIAGLNTARARNSIRQLIGAIPQTALLQEGQTHRRVPIAQLRPGDLVVVPAGDKIPVDGVVVSGDAAVNQAPLTGESLAVEKSIGDRVFAGTVLESGALDVRTEKVGDDTTFARIIALVEHAQEHQAPVQKLTDRIAAWLIPIALLFLTIVYLITRDTRLIVTLLIFTSPAELGLATPLVMIAAIARAARGGILIKGGIHLEALARIDAMVFDKTGTLTTGQPQVSAICPADGVEANDLLRLAAAADARSNHPLALAVLRHARARGIDFPQPRDFQTLQGRGIRATVDDQPILIGTDKLLRESDIHPPGFEAADAQTLVYVAAANRCLGVICFTDTIRPEAAGVLRQLRNSGVRQIMMLTGDNESTARHVARQLGIDQVRHNLLPEDKVAAIHALKAQGLRVAMIGDGINDAPALAAADVGIAMGAIGTQAAIEAADIALMTDDLSRIVLARTIARRAYRTIKENLFFGIGIVHIAGITAALLGWISPVEAALLHLGPDVLVFTNSVKLLRIRLPAAA